jgi:hypothetical protein
MVVTTGMLVYMLALWLVISALMMTLGIPFWQSVRRLCVPVRLHDSSLLHRRWRFAVKVLVSSAAGSILLALIAPNVSSFANLPVPIWMVFELVMMVLLFTIIFLCAIAFWVFGAAAMQAVFMRRGAQGGGPNG